MYKTAADFTAKDASSKPFAWMLENVTAEEIERCGVEQFVRNSAQALIGISEFETSASAAHVYKTWRSGWEFDQAVRYIREWLTVAKFEAVIEAISGADGMEAPYGGGDYTIGAWECMDGGYELVFTRSNTDIYHSKEVVNDAATAVLRMAEFNADPAAWYPVVFGE